MPDSFADVLAAAQTAEHRADYPAAIRLARHAASLAPDPLAEAEALRIEIACTCAAGQPELVEPRLERLGAIAEATEDERLRGEWLLLAGQWLDCRENHQAAERKFLDAAEAFAAVQSLAREVSALHAAADSANADGRPSDGAAHLSAALALARRSGDSALVSQSASRLAASLWELGEWAEAEFHHAEAYAIAKAAGCLAEANRIARDALRLSADRGRWHAARQAGVRLFPNGAASETPAGLGLPERNQALAAYGLALFHTGERDAAREFLAAAESADLTGLQDL